MSNLDLSADVIDVRDIIERVVELEVLQEDEEGTDLGWQGTTKEWDEFAHLEFLLSHLKGNGGDEQWRGDWYPLTLIRDGQAFEDYMDELLEDCGDIPTWDKLPSYVRIVIDYDQLKWDYQTIEIDGEDYLYR